MKRRLYKKGDIVKVWSLQSFNNGGFLKGVLAVVRQNQTKNSSVLLIVERNFKGDRRADMSYEVYPEQLKLIRKRNSKREVKVQSFLDLIHSNYAELNSRPKTIVFTKNLVGKEVFNLNFKY